MSKSIYSGIKCFVIMPFGKKKDLDGKPIDFNFVYHKVIKSAVEEVGLKCERCDEIIDTGSIHFKMFHGIFEAEVAVVDITSLNANVFYELGIRHALNKFVTLVIRKAGSPIPFNINGLTTIEYDLNDIEKSKETIGSYIRNGLKKQSVDSIVHLALEDTLKVERRQTTISKKEILSYPLASDRNKVIGLVTGDLKKINEVDVWVNSENTNMQMARHLELSISSTIRYLGAKKDKAGRVKDDIIADELRKIIGVGGEAPAGVVIPTTSGDLERTHNVKKIFHAASVTGQVGQGYKPIPNITECVYNALKLMDSDEMEKEGLHSILFPMMGSGTTRLEAEGIADRLLSTAISYLDENPNSKVQKVYFLTRNEDSYDICKHTLENESRVLPALAKKETPGLQKQKTPRKKAGTQNGIPANKKADSKKVKPAIKK